MHFALSGSSAIFPAFSFFVERKPLEISRLQITPLKFRPFWQENRGPTEIILRICTPFPGFAGFSQSQALDLQPQAPIQPLQKKSYQKHYRRFYGRSRMCHHRRMNVEMTGRNRGFAGWMAVKRRQPGLMMKSEIPQRPHPSHRSHWSHPSFLDALIKPGNHSAASWSIKPNQTQ